MLQSTNIRPVYGKHYAPGYVGFTYETGSLLSAGIAYFTHWDNMHEIPVSHVFTVEDCKTGIETHYSTGVRRVELEKLFDDPRLVVVFRKPTNLKPWEADEMLARLRPEIGKKYDTSLIICHMLTKLCAGRWLRAWIAPTLYRWFDSLDEWVCSELVAFGLSAVPRFRNKGILKQPYRSITPQQLFEDDEIFEAWKHKGGQ